MPTVYSANYSTGTYTYTRVRVDYSGTSATATLLYTRTNTYSGATGTGSPATFTFAGVSTSIANITFYGQQTDAVVGSVSFTIPTSGGTYSGSTSGYTQLLSFEGSVTIPPQSSAPTGLSVTPIEVYSTGAKFNVSVSSYGNPSSASGRFIEAGFAGQNAWVSPALRSANATNVSSAIITVNNSSTKTQTLTIQPNTHYYYGGYAWNTVTDTAGIFGTLTTLALPPQIALISKSSSAITMAYTISADGGYHNKTIEYSIDGGVTWTTITTISGGSTTSGTFTVTGLSGNKNYTLEVRSTTNAGHSSAFYYFNLSSLGLYGSVSNVSKKINDFYGEVGGYGQRAIKIYGSMNGKSKLVYQGFGHLTYN